MATARERLEAIENRAAARIHAKLSGKTPQSLPPASDSESIGIENINPDDEGHPDARDVLAGGDTPRQPVPVTDPRQSTAPSSIPYNDLITKYAEANGFDPLLIAGLIQQESSFNPRAVSNARGGGAKGLTQLMDGTAKEMGVTDSFDPEQNIKGGVGYLKKIYNRFKNVPEPDRMKLTLASYNGGYGHILDAQAIVKKMGRNPNKWSEVRNGLRILSPKYKEKLKTIWKSGRPRYGYFTGADETVPYCRQSDE